MNGKLVSFARSLVATPFSIAMTLVWIFIAYKVVPPVVNWALFEAVFIAKDGSECSRSAACWAFIAARFDDFVFGRYPAEERWRVAVAFALPLALALSSRNASQKSRGKILFSSILIFPVSVLAFMYGGVMGLEVVETRLWGGFALTLVIATCSIASALPIGILLALGRRSHMRVIALLSTIFIEAARSVPMITVLFVASIMFPFFVPEGIEIDKLLRTIIAISLFAGAYMAEVIRGGLQAVPTGQYEAAAAMGHGYWQSMRFVILPQALRISIPAIVNLFIGFFKDTTLVLVIGLFDLLNMVLSATSDPKWLGFEVEGYVFAAFVYFIFCYSMGHYARRLEAKQKHS
ncbi:amino acid ABC transporter permease [Roseovarius sp. 2305UL8-3]|uniref:amino acid ABC transporter permease n=1 Tax=Roseovarius conchicola TaxID=3121636 RepID=UPI0035290B40